MTLARTRSGKSSGPSRKSERRGAESLDSLNTSEALRERAEEIARAQASQTPEDVNALSSEATQRLLHELRVHQIELEMQNEELRRTQVELEASRARYYDLYDLAPVGYLTLNEKGTILEANLTAATLLGLPRGALVKKRISAFILPEDQDVFYRQRKQLSETGEARAFELRLLRDHEFHFWARLEATVAQGDDNAPVYRVVVSDITERKRAEEQVLAAERETTARTAEAVRARDEFISIAAHELKTPITSVQGYAQLILRDVARNGTVDPDRLSKSLDRIEQQSKRLTNLSDQLLSLSRLQAGRLVLSPVETDLPALLERVVEDQRHIHPEADIELCAGELAPAFVDSLRLEQVLVNLIDNAVKFSPRDTRLNVDLYEIEPGWVGISVRDHGMGIAEDQRERIFERYYQAHPGRHSGGMGIGLYVSRQIVEMHGGAIIHEAADDGGSRFVIRLPLRASPPVS